MSCSLERQPWQPLSRAFSCSAVILNLYAQTPPRFTTVSGGSFLREFRWLFQMENCGADRLKPSPRVSNLQMQKGLPDHLRPAPTASKSAAPAVGCGVAAEETLTYYAFPEERRRRIRTNTRSSASCATSGGARASSVHSRTGNPPSTWPRQGCATSPAPRGRLNDI